MGEGQSAVARGALSRANIGRPGPRTRNSPAPQLLARLLALLGRQLLHDPAEVLGPLLGREGPAAVLLGALAQQLLDGRALLGRGVDGPEQLLGAGPALLDD